MTAPAIVARHAAVLLATLAACAAGQAADAPYADMAPEQRQVCLKAPDYPPHDQPPATQPACDAQAAYYGIQRPVDDAKARACAYQARDYDVLAMLYANGLGVPRDLGVARRAACDAGGAPAEIAGRLRHLARLEAAGHGDKPGIKRFDFCDDITSGLMMGYCRDIRSRLAADERNTRMMELTVNWNNESKSAFTLLLQARDAFVKAHEGEVDLSGTARAAMVIAEDDEQLESFRKLLERASAGQLAAASPARAQAQDAALNATWRRLRATSDANSGTTMTLSDIQATQRAWLPYRDAWVALGKVQWPQVAAGTWVAVLTEQREQQLRELLGDRR